jgi:hypothetical protein
MITCKQRYLNKDRSFVMLTSCFGYILFSCFKAPEWYLNCWQIACCSYMSFYLAFSRKYGTVWYHPASSKFVSNYFSSFVSFQENWLARFGSGTCVKPASFGLMCAWREVLILRQQVQCVGALTGSNGSTTILAPVSDRMIRRLRRGNHRFIRQ